MYYNNSRNEEIRETTEEPQMAIIYGIEARNVRTNIVSERGRVRKNKTASIYINGKQVGLWVKDAYDDGDRFDFGVSKIENAIKEQCPDLSAKRSTRIAPALSKVIDQAVKYNELEKQWKDADARGCALLALTSDTGETVSYRVRKRDDLPATKMAAKRMAKMMAEEENFSGYSQKLFWDKSCFIVGEPLVLA